MITSESITAIAEALLGFHKEMGKIKKDANNPYFKSKYADISAILDGIRDPLISNGLIVLQFPDSENSLTTRLLHKSGEWMQSTFDLSTVPDQLKEKDKNGAVVWRGAEYISPQAQGSAITYARRYAQVAILNLNLDDDDGNQASGRPAQPDKSAIPKTLWDKALIRIDKGEKSLINKVIGMYMLTPDQLTTLNKKK